MRKSQDFHPSSINNMISGVSRILNRGWGSKSPWKNGGIYITLHAFARGVRGHAPARNLLKIVPFCTFWRTFCSNFVNQIVKIFNPYIEIIDNVLLCTLYLGVLDHTPQISCQLCNLVPENANFKMYPPTKNFSISSRKTL